MGNFVCFHPLIFMKKIFPLLLLVAALLGFWKWFRYEGRTILSSPDILGGVVMVENAGVKRLFYLTSQWEKRVTFTSGRASSTRRTTSKLNVDLWELDTITAQPVSRRRIKRADVGADSKALGVEQGMLWARIPELVGIRLADGVVVVNQEKIVARNPAIAGIFPKPPEAAIFLPSSMQPLRYEVESGMIVRLDDAREVRIDPLTLEATPMVEAKSDTEKSKGDAAAGMRLPVIPLSHGMEWNATVRGLSLPQTGANQQWLGLLTDLDLEMMREKKVISTQMDFTTPRRSRLYRATLQEVTGFFVTAIEHQNPTVLPDSPDFLMAGLLTQERSHSSKKSAFWGREPDSVLVLSLDRLGEEGRLQLARVSSEKGVPVWSVNLPLSGLSGWFPGEHHALLLGPAPSAERSPMAEENDNSMQHVLSVDLATGAMQAFNPDLHRDWPVEDLTK